MANTTRYAIESVIVKASVLKRVAESEATGDPKQYREIDPDADTETLVEYRDRHADAQRRAQEIYQRDAVEMKRSCWGQVTIQKEHYEQPYDEYPQIWEWVAVGDTESIS
jgi:hypothetical protein